MPKTIIADTSCFIILSKINELNLLQQLYSEIYTTVEIEIEFGQKLPNWVVISSPKDKSKQNILETQIDKGEASAITLALEMKESLIIIDDNKARKIAAKPNIKYTGTIGVIIKAKLTGIIPSIIPILNKIKKTDFRLPADIEIKALELAGEKQL
jgi:predicted nucleic acid-binding protein